MNNVTVPSVSAKLIPALFMIFFNSPHQNNNLFLKLPYFVHTNLQNFFKTWTIAWASSNTSGEKRK